MSNPLYEKEHKRRERDEKTQDLEKQRARLLNAMKRTFQTADGKVFLHWLMGQCSFLSPCLVLDPQSTEINIRSTLHNEALRGLYLQIRRHVPPEVLKEIEYEDMLKKEFINE